MFYMIKNRNFWVMLLGDAVLIFLAHYLSYYLRFDGKIPSVHFAGWFNTFTLSFGDVYAFMHFFGE